MERTSVSACMSTVCAISSAVPRAVMLPSCGGGRNYQEVVVSVARRHGGGWKGHRRFRVGSLRASGGGSVYGAKRNKVAAERRSNNSACLPAARRSENRMLSQRRVFASPVVQQKVELITAEVSQVSPLAVRGSRVPSTFSAMIDGLGCSEAAAVR